MSEMVERVAEVVWRELLKRELRHPSGVLDWEGTTREHRVLTDSCRAIARAVIKAMREPTEATRSAMEDDNDGRSPVDDMWRAAIDAALQNAHGVVADKTGAKGEARSEG